MLASPTDHLFSLLDIQLYVDKLIPTPKTPDVEIPLDTPGTWGTPRGTPRGAQRLQRSVVAQMLLPIYPKEPVLTLPTPQYLVFESHNCRRSHCMWSILGFGSDRELREHTLREHGEGY